jgi:hypothetical protein
MSDDSSRHPRSDELAAGMVKDMRLLGMDQMADYYAYWFHFGVLYFDSSGRIKEST